MEATLEHRGRTMKTVRVIECAGESDDAAVEAAMRAAGETPGSLFGWRIYRGNTTAIVDLYTD